MAEPTFAAPLETLRKRVHEGTQRLLGETIGISDEDWHRPSLLPGWSRANVAAHLAANADALTQLVTAAADGREVPLYADDVRRDEGVERGSELTGLDLQILLDTSAGRLERALDSVGDWTVPLDLAGRRMTMAQVPMARLAELVAHLLDLDCGYELDRLDQSSARWLLQWALTRYADDPRLPPLRVESTSGVTGRVGPAEAGERTVSGGDAALWGWLIGRGGDDRLEGADGLVPGLRS
ncbi:maleylpyruvate isomerase family mycothiol-dependent enzyme [Micropruina sonneratiae]|uniref:maleylpyruvate isomerase family mycothiol-dependent enzyme n=1 Tax=Micropruina sonneratiae TaxID=2986940 RepID=UPI002225F08B|nr:maleylpyruvate isomerase family mycothiol-dependent enzyme [Micropruina sp. KQZ13P-5]MCW3157178.1 maleylpyruvate isomerase family mycothiol-dependent enzyme [Micropruina sp. KQZ13P-5]